MPMRNRPQVYVVAKGYLLSMFYSNINDNSECDVLKKTKHKHNAELQRADPGTKVTGEFSTKGHIFPPRVWNDFLLFPSF